MKGRSVVERPSSTSPINKNGIELKSKAVEFATPRVSSAKAKIIRKEKLGYVNHSYGKPPRSGGGTTRNDGIPTAHVIPHTSVSLHMEGNLRRTNSSDYLRVEEQHIHPAIAGVHSPGRKWNSTNALHSAGCHDFAALEQDPDQTLLTRDIDRFHLDNNYCIERSMGPSHLTPHTQPQPHVSHSMYNSGGLAHSDYSHLTYPGSASSRHSRTGTADSLPSHLSRDIFNVDEAFATPLRTKSTDALSTYGSAARQMPIAHSPTVSVFQHDSSSSSMAAWQSMHKEQLRHQHASATQGLYTATPHPLDDPHKMDPVQLAADQIIQEKDSIIHRQRVKIGELEQLTHSQKQLQFENSNLKVQLQDALTSRQTLETKMNEREYELHETKDDMDKKLTSKHLELKRLQDQLKEQDQSVKGLEEQLKKMKSDNEKLKNNYQKATEYFSRLPTADEQAKNLTKIESLKKDLLVRDHRIETLKQDAINKKVMLEKYKAENVKLLQQAAPDLKVPETSKTYEDVEHLRAENQRLQSDLEKAKMMLDMKHKKLESAKISHATSLRKLEENLAQEEASVTALKGEIENKDVHLKKVRTSLKELQRRNQQLVEESLTARERVHELERKGAGETGILERRLHTELSVCLAELQSLVQVCIQQSQGQEPDISMLLGVKDNSTPDYETEADKNNAVQCLKHKLTKIKELRQEVEKLRELVSTKYAEELGDNLTCATH